MPPTAELAGVAMGSAALNVGVCLQRLANPGNSLLMPVMMKFTPIAATIRAMTRVHDVDASSAQEPLAPVGVRTADLCGNNFPPSALWARLTCDHSYA